MPPRHWILKSGASYRLSFTPCTSIEPKNKSYKVLVFQVADVGIQADILDFLQELIDAINAL
jgi:hypothetical protein